LKSLRVAEAKTGQPSRSADDPLMKAAQKKVNPFEFALHKGDVESAFIIAKAYDGVPAYKLCSDEDRRLVLNLLARVCTILPPGECDKIMEKKISKLTEWVSTGTPVN